MTKAKESDVKVAEATKKTPKAPKQRAQSNVNLAIQLLKEKATEEQILAAFSKVYKVKKGITDKEFIQARVKIYMAIAAKKQASDKKDAAKA